MMYTLIKKQSYSITLQLCSPSEDGLCPHTNHCRYSAFLSRFLCASLDTASAKTLFIIHVYHHTMSTVCYQFHGWTGSNLELLHETQLYRQH